MILPALVGMEFFIIDWPPPPSVMFFGSETADHVAAMERYKHRKMRPPELKEKLMKQIVELRLSICLSTNIDQYS